MSQSRRSCRLLNSSTDVQQSRCQRYREIQEVIMFYRFGPVNSGWGSKSTSFWAYRNAFQFTKIDDDCWGSLQYFPDPLVLLGRKGEGGLWSSTVLWPLHRHYSAYGSVLIAIIVSESEYGINETGCLRIISFKVIQGEKRRVLTGSAHSQTYTFVRWRLVIICIGIRIRDFSSRSPIHNVK